MKSKKKVADVPAPVETKSIKWNDFLLGCRLLSMDLSKTNPRNNIAKLVHPDVPQPYINLPTVIGLPLVVELEVGNQQIILKDGQIMSLNLTDDK